MPHFTHRPETPKIGGGEQFDTKKAPLTPRRKSVARSFELETWVHHILTEYRHQTISDLQCMMLEQRQWLANISNPIDAHVPASAKVTSDRCSPLISGDCEDAAGQGEIEKSQNPSEMALAQFSSEGRRSRVHQKQISKSLTSEYTGDEEGQWCTCVTQKRVDLAGGICIILNMVAMFIQLQWRDYEARVSLGSLKDDGAWDSADEWFLITEHVFNAVFLIEVVLRLNLFGCKFFKDGFNLFDLFLVAISSLQTYVLEPLTSGAGGNAFVIFRLLRFGRTVRVLRIVRVMRFFTELRILVQTFVSSARALAWSMLFLFFNILLGALFISFSLQDFIHTDSNDYTARAWAHKHYGSGWRSLYTLFEVTLAGCWPNYFRPLVEQVSVWYAVFIVTYISIVVFAVTRIITALFLAETMQTRSYDAEVHRSQESKNTQRYINNLRRVFEAADIDRGGTLDPTSFKRMCHNKDVVRCMKHLDLEIHDAMSLFKLLDVDERGHVNFEVFLKGVLRLKGQARSMDLIAMMRASDIISEQLRALVAKVSSIHEGLLRGF